MMKESVTSRLPIERTIKTQNRLGNCTGCSESALGARYPWFLHARVPFL